MSPQHKRKFEESHHDVGGSNDDQNYQGVGGFLAELKEASHHKPPQPKDLKEKANDKGGMQYEKNALSNTSNEWQTVGPKSNKRPKRKRDGEGKDRIKYPELICNIKVIAPIRLANLQALTLYTLADGVGPNWLAFKHAHHTRKVVMLMVPGLEEGMFDPCFPIKSASKLELDDATRQDSDDEVSRDPLKQKLAEYYAWKNDLKVQIDRNDIPMELKEDSLPQSLQPLTKIFREVWPVKAPGDSRHSRLYSPIQAMLLSPLPQTKEHRATRGPKPPVEETGWQPQRTPITAFIHTVDELREAEYPLHPAIFDNDLESSSLEKQRREKTNQNVEGGWVDTKVANCSDESVAGASIQQGSITSGRTVYAIDCEMVLTSDDKYSLARISIVDWNGKKVLDELVKPSLPIKNYYTQFSGVTKCMLDPIKTTLSEIQAKLLDLFTPQTILLGHSLESDLTAMKLTHPFVIDTSLIYPHPRGPPLRSSLKFLAQKYLKREIQQQAVMGHNSVEDALAVLDLVKLKCEKGPKWGTSGATEEPIFRRLTRNQKKDANGNERSITSAMIDHGTPERGYGKEATVQIGCGSDEEVVKGVARAVNGDVDGKLVPGGGVDFTWGRLRELESFRGWCNNNRGYSCVDKLHEDKATQLATPDPVKKEQEQNLSKPSLHAGSQTEEEPTRQGSAFSTDTKSTLAEPPAPLPPKPPTFQSTITATVSHICTIYDALPPCTLFILYSGTGDPREVGRLQRMQQQYRREFKVKKWDELTVKWTDDEEQALKKAVERAREGIAFLAVK